ncbi:unnamed protein product [Ambrosiozyma monospora]|uniref:Unnamed protein product n=1 Tax=Ambrosiozyma monospora TaxID=43982 RepID=A0A9W6YP24_AMBMO|nr:unnamed protein product [Ambrosiozyma monospora]
MLLEQPEIFNIVASNLNQIDLLNLSLVSYRFHTLSTPILFHSITVDSKYSRFDKEFKRTTYISKKKQILFFFKQDPSKLQLVHEFTVNHLPSEFIDFEKKLCDALPLFINLQVLKLDGLEVYRFNDLLNSITNPGLLQVLNVKLNRLSDFNILNSLNKDPNRSKFKLKSLNIGPISNSPSSSSMTLVDELTLSGYLGNLTDPELTQELRIVKGRRKVQLTDLVNGAAPIDDYLDWIPELVKMKSLTKLSLSDFNMDHLSLCSAYRGNVIADDDKVVDLSQLQFLELDNINEVNSRKEPIDTFLVNLINHNDGFPKLKKLKINVRQALADSIVLFLHHLRPNQLIELSLTMRYNPMKVATIQLELVTAMYIFMIRGQAESLQLLSFEILYEKNLGSSSILLTADEVKSLMSVKYPNLESLRFETKFSHLISMKDQFFGCFPKLQRLWVLNSDSVTRHWGLGNEHPGIFDDWLSIQHLPEQLISGEHRTTADKDGGDSDAIGENQYGKERDDKEINGSGHTNSSLSLKYIKVDKCLFEVKETTIATTSKTEVVPRDTIDEWFNEMTNVTF